MSFLLAEMSLYRVLKKAKEVRPILHLQGSISYVVTQEQEKYQCTSQLRQSFPREGTQEIKYSIHTIIVAKPTHPLKEGRQQTGNKPCFQHQAGSRYLQLPLRFRGQGAKDTEYG